MTDGDGSARDAGGGGKATGSGPAALRGWWVWLLVWPVGVWASLRFLPPLEQALPEATAWFLPDDSPSLVAARAFAEAFGESEKSSAALVVVRPAGLTDADRAFLDRLTAALQKRLEARAAHPTEHDWPSGMRSPSKRWAGYNELVAERMLSRDGQAAVLTVQFPSDIVSQYTIDALGEIDKMVAEAAPPEALQHALTGSAAMGRDYAVAAKRSLDSTLLYTLLGVMAVLLLVYRSPAAVAVSLVTVSVAFIASKQAAGVLALMHLPVTRNSEQFLIVLLYGAGTDFCLFLFARYREELAALGRPPTDMAERRAVMARALRAVAHPILGSAFTTSIALGTMTAARFGAYSSAGPALAVGLLIATGAAITLAPAMMLALRGGLFWPLGSPVGAGGRRTGGAFAGLWARMADVPAAKPVSSVVVVLAAAVPFFWSAAGAAKVYDSLQDMPHSDSARGAALFAEHFPRGEAFPLSVLVRLAPGTVDKPGTPPRKETLALDEALADAIAAMPSVADVRSLRDPFGRSGRARLEDYVRKRTGGLLGGLGMAAAWAESSKTYAAPDGRTLRLDVIMASPPYGNDALDLVAALPEAVRATAAKHGQPGAEVFVLGTTPTMTDIRAVTSADLRRVAALVGVALLAILVFLLRDVLLSLILIAATAAGYYATLGLAAVLSGPLFGAAGLDWKLEFFLFCILVAVGQDYNIFIVSRIQEESAAPDLADRPRSARAAEAVRRAVAGTGGIISCCGAVMAVTFGSLMSAPLTFMKQNGLALAAGVLIDTFLIRPLLVPAAYVLLETWRDRRRG